jgi:hypothetical protein
VQPWGGFKGVGTSPVRTILFRFSSTKGSGVGWADKSATE